MKKLLSLGGTDIERLYLHDCRFKMSDGTKVLVKKTLIHGKDMADLIARHKSRYALVALFSRPGYHILDFPCGSGYASEFLKDFGIIYEGKDNYAPTIIYAKNVYGNKKTIFGFGDLCAPELEPEYYDTIGCVEGLEHIDREFQQPLIAAFYKALKPGGTLIISSPESDSGVSGPSVSNPFHKWELSRKDFLALLGTQFKPEDIDIAVYKSVLSDGPKIRQCFFGICHK